MSPSVTFCGYLTIELGGEIAISPFPSCTLEEKTLLTDVMIERGYEGKRIRLTVGFAEEVAADGSYADRLRGFSSNVKPKKQH